MVRAQYALQLDPFLPPGKLALTLTLIDPARGVALSEPVTLQTIAVQALPRSFDALAMARALDIVFGDALDLLGYDAKLGAECLDLTLHWRARERLDVPYKFFVHLYDAESGEVVAQADVMPRDWSYPAMWWEKGEVVSDEISLPLQDVPSGLGAGPSGPARSRTGRDGCGHGATAVDRDARVHSPSPHLAEMHRVRGVLHLKAQAKAEGCFERAIDIAQEQAARLWELRATVSLARLWQAQGRAAEAHSRLSAIYGWFTEELEIPDLVEAREVLEDLKTLS